MRISLTIIVVILFIFMLIIEESKKFYLTMNFSTFIRKNKDTLYLYIDHNMKGIVDISMGNLFKWYLCCGDSIFVINRFKNSVIEYNYSNLPIKDSCYLSKKINLSHFE